MTLHCLFTAEQCTTSVPGMWYVWRSLVPTELYLSRIEESAWTLVVLDVDE